MALHAAPRRVKRFLWGFGSDDDGNDVKTTVSSLEVNEEDADVGAGVNSVIDDDDKDDGEEFPLEHPLEDLDHVTIRGRAAESKTTTTTKRPIGKDADRESGSGDEADPDSRRLPASPTMTLPTTPRRLENAGSPVPRQRTPTEDRRGLDPTLAVFNLATYANITANATCGERRSETYCDLIMPGQSCHTCDARDPRNAHPITNAIDGTHRWWQSPSLSQGDYNQVAITLDLKQVYQVAYVIVKAANSPRPGNWILEKSMDGKTWSPWQFYAISDSECLNFFGVDSMRGRRHYLRDDEVGCTPGYSKINPLTDGEIFQSLINGRPGVDGPSPVLREFSQARYIRLNFKRIRTLNADLIRRGGNLDWSVTNRYFYSIKDISIGGQCICFGHASRCPLSSRGVSSCVCEHNTCGPSCEKCCPMFNQKAWRPATFQTGNFECEKCQCHGKADECVFDPDVASRRESMNIRGEMDGGGVCQNCREDTEGNNCERCIDGFYRPRGVRPSDPRPCRRCPPPGEGTLYPSCVKDESKLPVEPGNYECREGFEGNSCGRCAPGFRNYPRCEPCPCNRAGTENIERCDDVCRCKPNVEGRLCDRCQAGHFHLEVANPAGCTSCFCFGISKSCRSLPWGKEIIRVMQGWSVTNSESSVYAVPTQDDVVFTIIREDAQASGLGSLYYWLAPQAYLGNRLSSYGGSLKYLVGFRSFSLSRGRAPASATGAMDVILEAAVAGNGIRLGYIAAPVPEGEPTQISVILHESHWMRIDNNSPRPATREDFLVVLSNLQKLMIRAAYSDDQSESSLQDVKLDYAAENSTSRMSLPAVERCQCPRGYSGLSCESCEDGYRRLRGQLVNGMCVRCECHGHADTCSEYDGRCENCKHKTMGAKCDTCQPGFFGDPRRGGPDDCLPCRCPFDGPEGRAPPRCRYDPNLGMPYEESYVCDECPPGHTGIHCQRCADGFFGTPNVPGNYCRPCDCNNNVDPNAIGNCDATTGECRGCIYNTDGPHCESCLPGFYGKAKQRDCRDCGCDPHGSISNICDGATGQCTCQDNHEGIKCDRCKFGLSKINGVCQECRCNLVGSRSLDCDEEGQCTCQPGVTGKKCDSCMKDHYGFSEEGCQACDCSEKGSISTQCHPTSGDCACKFGVTGVKCDACREDYYGFGSEDGCVPCNCDGKGSLISQCNGQGQCVCKPGVTGDKCDQCQPGYFGFSSPRGCRKCPTCAHPGQTCDAVSGKCNCPKNTVGNRCERCGPNAYDYDKILGCKSCNCHPFGSESLQCSDIGDCTCKPYVIGQRCDTCQPGTFMFPMCKKCRCDRRGADPESCVDKFCECGETGECRCKAHVRGDKCDKCKGGFFNLMTENKKGCDECFCFTRCDQCENAKLKKMVLKMSCDMKATLLSREGRRTKFGVVGNLDFFVPDVGNNTKNPTAAELSKYCAGVLAPVPRDTGRLRRSLSSSLSSSLSRVARDVTPRRDRSHAIYRGTPGENNEVRFNVDRGNKFRPLYWSLPEEFLGDKISSYGGKLKFTLSFVADAKARMEFPLVRILGNFILALDYHPKEAPLPVPEDNRFEIPLHESEWRLTNFPNTRLTRRVFLTALQNVNAILIRGFYGMEVIKASLMDVSLEVDNPVGVEDARSYCDPEYVGLSCQDPAPKYYRDRDTSLLASFGIDLENPDFTSVGAEEFDKELSESDLIGLVGIARPCRCFGHTSNENECDRETGKCLDCEHNTAGDRCDICRPGFFGDPRRGTADDCAPCPMCKIGSGSDAVTLNCTERLTPLPAKCGAGGAKTDDADCADYQCVCPEGFDGAFCDRCADGFFGNPKVVGGCKPCQCDDAGSQSMTCNKDDGQCLCFPGISGRRCDSCDDDTFAVVKVDGRGQCKACDEGCTRWLFESVRELEAFSKEFSNVSAPLPTGRLMKLKNESLKYQKIFDSSKDNIEDNIDKFERDVRQLKKKTSEVAKEANETLSLAEVTVKNVKEVMDKADDMEETLMRLHNNVSDAIDEMKEYAKNLEEKQKNPNHKKMVEEMLKKARKILDEMKKRKFRKEREQAEEELRQAMKLLEKVDNKTITAEDLQPLVQKLENLKKMEKEAAEKLDEVKKIMDGRTQDIIDKGLEYEKIVEEIEKLRDEIIANLDVEQLFKDAKKNNEIASQEFRENIDRKRNELSEKIPLLERMQDKTRNDIPEAEKEVEKAKEHADSLVKRKDLLVKKFQGAKNFSGDALRAANAYKNITQYIMDAERAAKEAKEASENATRAAEEIKDLMPKTTEATDETLKRAQDLKKRVDDVNEQHKSAQNELNKIEQLDLPTAEENEKKLSDQINEMYNKVYGDPTDPDDSGLTGKVRKSSKEIDAAADKTKAAADRVNYYENETAKMRVEVDKLLEGASKDDISKARKQVDDARDNLDSIEPKLRDLNSTFLRIEAMKTKLQYNIDKLREQLKIAHGVANLIDNSKTFDTSAKSYRSFVPRVSPGLSNSIEFYIKVFDPTGDQLIFYMGEPKGGDFLAVDMIDNRLLRFSWDVGAGCKSVTLDKPLRAAPKREADSAAEEVPRWYKVTAIRDGIHATLRAESLEEPKFVAESRRRLSDEADLRYSKLDLHKKSHFFVGGVPDAYQRYLPNCIRPKDGFNGAVADLLFNHKPVGLYDFSKNLSYPMDNPAVFWMGNSGFDDGGLRMKSLRKKVSELEMELDGTGYAKLRPKKKIDRFKSFQLGVSTRWINSVLLFYGDEDLHDDSSQVPFTMIAFEDGKVVLRQQFEDENGNFVMNSAATKQRYNTNEKFKITFEHLARSKSTRCQLKVHHQTRLVEELEMECGRLQTVDNGTVFIGGFPMYLNLPDETKGLPRLLGCISDLSNAYGETYVLPKNFVYYGADIGCRMEEHHRAVSFLGDGWVELDIPRFNLSRDSISFMFNTKKKDTMLLLATGKYDTEFWSFSLEDGNLVAKLGHNGKTTVFDSSEAGDTKYNTGNWVVVTLARTPNNLNVQPGDPLLFEVFVDTKSIAGKKQIGEFSDPIDINVDKLYIGGVSDNVAVGDKTASDLFLVGAVKDIVVSDKVLFLDTKEKNYHRADLGRAYLGEGEQKRPRFVKTFQFDGTQMKLLTGNDVFADATDKDMLKLDMAFWAYWNDAPVLMIADRETNPREYMALYIKDTKLHLAYKTRDGQAGDEVVEIEERVNIADWVDLMLARDASQTSLKLSVDGRVVATLTRPSDAIVSLLDNPVLTFGGFNFTQEDLEDMGILLDPSEDKRFLGAMKGIKINDVDIDLTEGPAGPMGTNPKEGFNPDQYTVSTFSGDGHILLTTNKLSLDRDFVVAFDFAAIDTPEGSDGLLLLGRNGNTGYFSVGLVDSKVQARFRTRTSPEVVMTSLKDHNTRARKSVEIRYDAGTRSLTMNVDGDNANSVTLPGADGSIDVTRLFIGGYPEPFKSDGVVPLPHSKSVLGYVENVKIGVASNPVPYPFGAPADFENADIGRRYLPRPPPEGDCAVTTELVQEENALRFGDHRLSRAVVNPFQVVGQDMAEDFKRRFTISFKFRSFYKNGILFYMEPSVYNKDVYLTAYLMDGNVVLNFKKPKDKPGQPSQKGLMTDGLEFSDGNFHEVKVVKDGKSISLQVDGGEVMEGKMKKSSEAVDWSPKLKIGGPRTSMPFKLILYPLQGCVKDFRINEKLSKMEENPLGENRHAKPCNTPREGGLIKGAHFSGQGYARLYDQFVIDDWMQIKLKFKTTSREGVLLALGSPDDPQLPCLMLELHQGELILRLQTRSGTRDSMVTFQSNFNKFKDGFEVCNNKWHSVDARIVRTVLMLIVDEIEGKTAFNSDAQQKHEGEIKFYIGGIPDNERDRWPLQPMGDSNFRGCVKDVMVKDYDKDEDNVVWSLSSSSIKISNVDISACP